MKRRARGNGAETCNGIRYPPRNAGLRAETLERGVDYLSRRTSPAVFSAIIGRKARPSSMKNYNACTKRPSMKKNSRRYTGYSPAFPCDLFAPKAHTLNPPKGG